MLSGTYITDIGDINASSGVYKRVSVPRSCAHPVGANPTRVIGCSL